jgi:Flp pilus assembly protein TadD
MKLGARQALFAAACLWLAGCETTSTNVADWLKPNAVAGANSETAAAETPASTTETTGSIAQPEQTGSAELTPSAKALLGGDPNDDLSMGKQFFRNGNYGLAERSFRRAAEAHPRDAEAWLGLAASYDRLKRFDLADRAYDQLLRITGPTPEVLNNIGYSYMLRGDYTRARQRLVEAQAKDPQNPYVRTNLELLEKSLRTRKAIR